MRIEIADKMRTWHLRIFLYVSLGLHLLFLSILTPLFPDFKIDRLPIPNIEVSLLPLISEEKQREAQVKMEEKRFLQNEKKEEPFQKNELEPELPSAIQTAATNIPIEEPKTLPPGNRRLELGNEKEPVIQEMNISSQSDSTLTFEKESLLMVMPQSKVSYEGLFPNTDSSEGSKRMSKLPSISEEDILPKVAKKVKPIYPQWAKEKGYQGEGILRVQLFSDGKVGKIEVKKSSGHEILDRCAIDAVKQWKFIPGSEWYWVNIPFKFEFNENSIKNSPPLRDSRKR